MALTEGPPPASTAARVAAIIALALGGIFVALGLALLIVNGHFDSYSVAALVWGLLLLTVFGFFEPDTVRGLIGRGQVRAGSKAVLQVVLVLAAVVLLNLVVRARLADKQLDLSKDQVNSLSGQTVQVLHSLDHPVQATLWYDTAVSEVSAPLQLLQRYHDVTGNFTVQAVGLRAQPGVAQAQHLTTFQSGLVVFQYNGKQDQTTDASEQGLTSTLLRLTAGGTPKAYFLTGHGERSLSDSTGAGYAFIKQELTQQGFVTADLNLVAGAVPGLPGASPAAPSPSPAATPDTGASPAASPGASPSAAAPAVSPSPAGSALSANIPADADVIAIVDPTSPLSGDEVKALQAYFERGGRLFFSASPFTASNPNDLLKKYGLTLSGGDVIDPTLGVPQRPDFLVVTSYGSGVLTRGLAGLTSLVGITTPIKGTAATGYTETPIITSSADACESKDSTILSTTAAPACHAGDAKGPFTVFATLEQSQGKTGARLSRMVVAGGALFAVNQYSSNVQQAPGNLPLFINSMNWLAQRDKVINIPTRTIQPNAVFLSPGQKSLVFYGYVFFLPAILIAMGIAVYLRRR
ncbi:MAG TPA: Gldg family protein [Candidatus Dormibacteraeota bacterium]|nr:Gldg family protein [Candidatus Dormibacteraeota bacterium]